MFLTRTEIAELTGKSRFKAQARALAWMKIPFLVRPDGSLKVSRDYVQGLLGDKERPKMRKDEPNWSAI